ncbi:class I glutamine amidotransferase-like protein [Truncatella angustata]|uniref:Class I glutamine amidotransferase-like protein n=1 Tax=Truncatella angustata TaxID=152316 RepID=A0A9P8UBT8_9PEZI|nr:class I glutamine amidotransferase-like protein [Truncatella angustata]KAH6644932.1 class I glutamine amidotransferase-like protein [Truncatella angustata]
MKMSRWKPLEGKYPSETSGIDAFIITGSVCSVYDDFPWIRTLMQYIRYIYDTQPHIKFFGSCFGHQILAQSLLAEHGVRVEKSKYGWENGVHDVTHSAQFTAYFPLLREEAMRYQFVHQDEVVADYLPYGWLSIGYSDMCAIQGLFQPGRVLTYQGHPEFDRDILYYFMDMLDRSGAIDDVEYATSLKLIDQDTTSGLAAEVVLKFLEM